jgi:hypothetical protein
VNNGGTSEIEVKFKREPYVANITVNGSQVDVPTGKPSWAFVVTRQDTVDLMPSGPSRETSFVLSEGERHRFVLDGHYDIQHRNLRFTFSY